MQQAVALNNLKFITTPEGKPKSVVIDINDWEKIVETLRITSSRELMSSIRRAKKELKIGTGLLKLKEVFNL